VFELLQVVVADTDPRLRDEAVRVVLRHLYPLLDAFPPAKLAEMFKVAQLSEDEWNDVRRGVAHYLEWQERTEPGNSAESEHRAEIQSWYAKVRPTGFRERVRELLSRNPWDEKLRGRDGRIGEPVLAIAREALSSSELLNEVLSCVASGRALSASLLGAALAQEGAGPEVATAATQSAIESGNGDLVRGLVHTITRSNPSALEGVRVRLDELDMLRPLLCFDLVVAAGDELGGSKRAFALVDAGRVPSVKLEALWWGVGSRMPSINEIREVLKRLILAGERGDVSALHISLMLVTYQLGQSDVVEGGGLLDDPECRQLSWRVAELVSEKGDSSNDYHWKELMGSIYGDDPALACRLAVQRLLHQRAYGRETAREVLAGIGRTNPQEVMDAFGAALVDEERGASLRFDGCKDVISVLPAEIVETWVEARGIDGARAIACHLPTPYIGSDDVPIVPKSTERVLAKFGNDKVVFSRFISGVHPFEIWRGDRTGELRREAAAARRFLSHPVEAIRKWADLEALDRERLAEAEHREHEERFLE
jgi:hypothetical protein